MALSYRIWTIGCQMNEADARHLAAHLERAGCVPAPDERSADLVILNTCVVRRQVEDKIRGKLRVLAHLKRGRPDLIVAVMGCMIGFNESSDVQEAYPFVDVAMPPSTFSPLLRHLAERGLIPNANRRAVADAMQDDDFSLPLRERDAVTAFVPAVLGCSHACSYCIIPYRRGAEVSRPRADILREVRDLAAQGVREITLLGQIVDRYGIDLSPPTSLAALLRDVAAVEDILRVRFLTSHPNWLTDDILDAVANEPKVCPHIEVPFQAGSDAVLERMRRGYTADDYRRLVERIRRRIPDAAIHTDIIVGFPGETLAQFEESLRLLDELELDMARIAKYSPRPKTEAARRFPDDVPEAEKEERRLLAEARLRALLTRKHAALRGRDVPVLVEGRERHGRWRGRTPQSKLVFFDDPRDLRGRIVDVPIVWAGPFSLVGPTDTSTVESDQNTKRSFTAGIAL